MNNKQVIFEDWGLIDYKVAWNKQEALFAQTVKLKIELRNQQVLVNAAAVEEEIITPNYLIFCEHPHVYTLGKSGKPEHLLLDENGLKEKDALLQQRTIGGIGVNLLHFHNHGGRFNSRQRVA